MIVLGIESTCDETGAAVVRDGREILSNVIASQVEVHRPFGGVVPEIASRQHIERISPTICQALADADVQPNELDLISVAKGPGLIGALLVGIETAKGMALGLNRPLIGINHVEAHLYANIMTHEVEYPALGIVVSGGHTMLLRIREVGSYEMISSTVDDAIGEAFDKVASLLGLPYPGGPYVEELAKKGDPHAYLFHAGQVKGKPFHFSFSGLKTNVLYTIKGQGATKHSQTQLSDEELANVAASFQECALRDIATKAKKAVGDCRSILIGGGVSNNRRLRKIFTEEGLEVLFPPPELTLDNAAMIAGLAYPQYQRDGVSKNIFPQPRMLKGF